MDYEDVDDPTLDSMDQRAQELRARFLGPDYAPDVEEDIVEEVLNADITYLDNTQNIDLDVYSESEVIGEHLERLEESLSDGLDRLTSTLIQRSEDSASRVEASQAALPALLGAPTLPEVRNLVETNNNPQHFDQRIMRESKALSVIEGEYTNITNSGTGNLPMIPNVFNRSNPNDEDNQYEEMKEEEREEQNAQNLEEINQGIKDLAKGGGDTGFGLIGDLLGGLAGIAAGASIFGNKKGKAPKTDPKAGQGRWGKFKEAAKGVKGGTFGAITQGILTAGAAYYMFKDFIQPMMGEESASVNHDMQVPDVLRDDRKESPTQIAAVPTTAEQIASNNDSLLSNPFVQGTGLAAAGIGVGLMNSRFMGERAATFPSYGARPQVPMLPSLYTPPTIEIGRPVNPPVFEAKPSMAKQALTMAGTVGKTALKVSDAATKRLPYVTAAIDSYQILSDEEASAKEKASGLAGVGGGMAGASAGGWVGAKIGAGLGGAIGSVIPIVGTGFGAALGGVAGGLYGSYKGYNYGKEEATGLMDWLLGNDEQASAVADNPEAQQVAEAQKQLESWWKADPENLQRNEDGTVSIAGQDFRDERSYNAMRKARLRHEESMATAKETGNYTESEVAEVATSMLGVAGAAAALGGDEKSIEDAANLQKDATGSTKDNTKALNKLADSMLSPMSFGLLGMISRAATGNGVWDSVKGLFGFGSKDKEAEKTEGTEVEAQAVDGTEASEEDKQGAETRRTMKSFHDSIKANRVRTYSAAKQVAPKEASFKDVSKKDALTSLGTYSDSKAGYDSFVRDFGDILTFEEFKDYKANGVPQTDVVADVPMPPPPSQMATVEAAMVGKQPIQPSKEVTDVGAERGADYSHRQKGMDHRDNPWFGWADADSSTGNHVDLEKERVESGYYDTAQNVVEAPQPEVAVQPTEIRAQQSSFADDLELAQPNVTVNVPEQKKEKDTDVGKMKRSTREQASTTTAQHNGTQNRRPSLDEVPTIINNSGITAINLGFM